MGKILKINLVEALVVILMLLTIYFSLVANFSIYYISKVFWFGFSVVLFGFCSIINSRMIALNNHFAYIYLIGWGLFFIFQLLSSKLPSGAYFINLVEVCMILSLRKDILNKIVDLFVQSFSIFLVFSIIEYLIFLTTGYGIVLDYVERVGYNQQFCQLVFNVFRIENSFPRFCSLVEEPGLLGTFCGFLLVILADKKEIKYKMAWFVFFISGILSFSFAFFIMLFVYNIFRIKPKPFFISIALLFVSYLMFQDVFDSLLIDRINNENFEERTHDSFNRIFDRAYDQGSLWLGCGDIPDSVKLEGVGAGAKVFIYQFGILSTVVLFLFYNTLFVKISRKMDYHGVLFLLIFWLSFYQRQTIDTPYTLIAFIGAALNSSLNLNNFNCERLKRFRDPQIHLCKNIQHPI